MKWIAVGATGVMLIAGIGSAAAATHTAASAPSDTAIVGPILGAAAAGSQVGSGTVPSLMLGVVSTAIAPIAGQQPQLGAAIASAAGQVTTAMAQAGAPATPALDNARLRLAVLAPAVNPLVNPVLDAAAAQLRAQGANAAGTPLGVELSGLASYAEFLKGR